MSKTMKVFVACFLGGFIGTIVALQLHAFWWLGLFAGGFVGYLAYEFKIVLQVIPKAWQAAAEWRPNKKWWKSYFSLLWPVFCVGSTIAIGNWVFWGVIFLLSGDTMKESSGALFSVELAIFVSLILGTPILTYVVTRDKSTRKSLLSQAKKYNPVNLYLWLIPKYILRYLFISLKWLFFVIYRTPKFFWKVTIVIGRFIKTLFILIHSDERLLCGTDAAIGTIIGFIAGNAVVGGLAGGVFGVLNFEILSKHILHLVPAKSKN